MKSALLECIEIMEIGNASHDAYSVGSCKIWRLRVEDWSLICVDSKAFVYFYEQY
jgi:hypothetical protein